LSSIGRSACLRCDGVVLPLRPKSFDVLVYLVQNPGRLVPKRRIDRNVWQDVMVTDNSLVQCIKDIRQALNDNAHAEIETVAKRGYLFCIAGGCDRWQCCGPRLTNSNGCGGWRDAPCRCPIVLPLRYCHSPI